MYFNSFSKINYDIKGDGQFYSMTNLTKRVRFNKLVKENIVAFDFYDVQDGDTPEIVAHYYYQDAKLHWIILLTNDIVDVYTQWPMSIPRFEQFIKDKYDDINAIHHYEITQSSGDTTKTLEIPNNTDYPNATAVTNYNYESNIQNKISRIRLIRPEYVEQIKRELNNLVYRA